MNKFMQVCAPIAVALALSPSAFADPPAGKGPQGQGQSQGNSQGNSAEHAKGGKDSYDDDRYDDDRYDDKNKDASNHGQIVSECKHRANQRNLKGQDRKEWTEWCEDRGSRYKYDYNRYSTDRNCYQKADNKGLSGDKRRKFINDCLDRPNRY